MGFYFWQYFHFKNIYFNIYLSIYYLINQMAEKGSYKTEAIILNSREVNEFDRIYDIFSQDFGKTSILAKGVRKPAAKLSSGLEPITHSEIFLAKGRSLDRVTGVIIHNQYQNIKEDLDRIKMAKSVFPIFKNSFLETNFQHKEIFRLLISFLNEISSCHNSWEKIRFMRIFLIWKTICLFGNQPELFQCSHCQKKFKTEDVDFWLCSSSEILCKNCSANIVFKKIKIDASIIKVLRIIVRKDWELVRRIVTDKNGLKKLEQISQLVLESILDNNFRMD